MVTLAEYSRLVSAIHAAAVTPEHWVDAMAAVREIFDGTSGADLITGPNREMTRGSMPAEARQAYNGYYRRFDYVLDAVDRSPVGLIHCGRTLVDLDRRSEFHADWIRPNHMDDGVFVRLAGGERPACFVIADRRRDEPFLTVERTELVTALIPHLQQALRTEKHLEDLRRDAGDLASAIDCMRQAVLVVGRDAAVVHCNSAAALLLHRADGLMVRSGRLRASRSEVDCAVQRAVADALGVADGAVRSGASVLCPRPSGERAYVAHTFPFAADARHDRFEPRALIVIADPGNRPQPPKEMLRKLFGLTNGESDVALRVARGQGLAPISEDLSVSVATVKTHLQHVFDKTDTHRQAELVRLLTALLP
ncbi:LuxR family transcriptional regulator [Mycolicibacterium litorale]|uniref:LuxR family transcriptional regulator n=1 Tax=Mycolicibacterium litorale TaxID=758802 RepID=A0A6S6NY74_9MYCO|nr:helix-turn-helix transcriptional regulator [Mycolicibacterium litorale]BCI51374.1 LuxR family transcriptional regulator [Mycolicibacterium litorale]